LEAVRASRPIAAITGAFTLFGLIFFLPELHARKVLVSIPGLSQLIAFATAKEKGYYRDEDLDVEFIWMRAGVSNQALISGNVDFATLGAAGVTAAISGHPLRVLFSTFSKPMFSLYAKPEIPDIRALRGKKIGVSSIGTGADSLLREALKKHGLEGGRDAVILSIGVTPTRFTALVNGSVDATMLTPPLTFNAEQAGFRELVNFAKEDFVEIQGSVVLRESLLQTDPTLVERFVRGTFKGFLYARDNRSGTIPVVARSQQVNAELATKTYDSALRPAMTADGTIPEDLQHKTIDYLAKRLGAAKAPPPHKIFDYALVKKIHADLQAKGWKPQP
jgi:ABC-type nitrate/sulfonate/bicarbonate transport system substrate-binding protein